MALGAEEDLELAVLVPPTFVWWTFLALAARPEKPKKITFVNDRKVAQGTVVVSSTLLGNIESHITDKFRLIILLWDGYESFLQVSEKIRAIQAREIDVELWSVGELPIDKVRPFKWSYLFNQKPEAYDARLFFSKQAKGSLLEGIPRSWTIRYRGTLISLKVLSQLARSGRFAEYSRTRFVFCGQSGLYTLKRYCSNYQVHPDSCNIENGGIDCSDNFILSWIVRILGTERSWRDQIALRALFRMVGLRKSVQLLGDSMFLNLYPEENINAYQAQFLFQKHTFLDYGGMNGDESIYPRAADLILLARTTVKFGSSSYIQKMLQLAEVDEIAIAEILKSYEHQISETLGKRLAI